jgi:hypothetical protein
MKRFIVGVVICSVSGVPVFAEERGADANLNLRAIVAEKAIVMALQVPQTQQPPPPPQTAPTGPTHTRNEKMAYFITLAGAAAGVIYNITTTRDALDHRLEARTFPIVWQKTKDPADKAKVSGTIAAANGGLLAIGAIVFQKGNAPLATFLNVLVGGGTAAIGLRNRSIINDCLDKGTCK